jgi:N-acyl-D-aspartate/D-glutamate deacylase
MVTGVPAAAWGLADRGVLEEGKAADINVIDFERLMPNKLEVRTDLPGGAKRLVQGATGYAATIVAGKVVLRDGVHTASFRAACCAVPRSERRSH